MAIVKIDEAALARLNIRIEVAMYNALVDLKIIKQNEQVIPYRTGATQKSAKVTRLENNVVELSYNTQYSNYIYHHPEIPFNKLHNINAQALWLEDLMNGSRNEEIMQIMQKYIGRIK